jgi:tetratricopeptide (TPR) repeat protein
MKTRLLLLGCSVTAVLAVAATMIVVRGGEDAREPVVLAPIRTTATRIASLEQQAVDRPDDSSVLVQLGAAYLQRVRETGDPSFYALADRAAERATALEPDDPNVLVLAGTVANSKHDFAGGLELGRRAHEIEPTLIAAYSVIVDSLVELGRYDEAIIAAQEMADLRPDFAALSRISYIRELHGDLDGAIEAMRMAVAAGTGVPADEVWGRVLLGNLLLTSGDIEAAAKEYEQAAAILPGDGTAEYGLARLALARREYAAAEQHLRAAVNQRPLPEYLITFGELLESQGRTAEAEQHYATVRAIQQLFAASGVDTDLELALFDADHGDTPEDTYAKAAAAYDRRPSVYAADVAAWTAYRAGYFDEAQRLMAEAISLGTRDPRLSYHAGVIALAVGDTSAARAHFEAAMRMEAGQSSALYIANTRAQFEQVRATN